jgi:hypothetical protein
MKEEGLPKKMCCTGHHKGKGEEGNLHMSIKVGNTWSRSQNMEVWRRGTGRADYCGDWRQQTYE